MEQCELIAVRAPRRIAAAASADAGAAADADRATLPFAYWAGRHAFQKRAGASRGSGGASGGAVLPSAESLKLFSETMESSRGTGVPTGTASAPSTAMSQVWKNPPTSTSRVVCTPDGPGPKSCEVSTRGWSFAPVHQLRHSIRPLSGVTSDKHPEQAQLKISDFPGLIVALDVLINELTHHELRLRLLRALAVHSCERPPFATYEVLVQATPRSPDVSSRHATAADGGSQHPTDTGESGQRVFLQSTRHVARAWATYGALLPIFKSTADVPVHISRAVQSLFEEFMLWTVVTFAGVTPAAVVRGVNGKDDRFFRVVWSLMLRSDRASRTRRYGSQLQAAVQAADKADGKGGDAGKGTAGGVLRSMELQEGVGLGGGTLDRLVRGTIACDALATLAQDLLELEPVLVCLRLLKRAMVQSGCRQRHTMAAPSAAATRCRVIGRTVAAHTTPAICVHPA